jgi:hypothetical protein
LVDVSGQGGNCSTIINLEIAAGTLPPVTAPPGQMQAAYSFQLPDFGLAGQITYSIDPASAPLPPGMTIEPSGLLIGTPVNIGAWSFLVDVITPGQTNTTVVTFTVGTTAPVAFPNALQFSFYANSEIGIQNAVLVSGTIPPGFSLNSSGELVGTAPVSAFGTYSFVMYGLLPGLNLYAYVPCSIYVSAVVTPDMAGDIAYFNNGAALAKGTYVIAYLFGAINFRGNWCLNLNQSLNQVTYGVVGAGFGNQPFPGTSSAYPNATAVQLANAGKTLTVQGNGQLGIQLSYFPPVTPTYTNAPAFSLTQIG